MRHTFFVLATSAFLAIFAGCANPRCNQCESCRGKAAGGQQQQAGSGGAVSYPYYTTRGPRDFLETHPQSIGP